VVFEDGIEKFKQDASSYYQIDATTRYKIASLKRVQIGRYNYDFGLFRLIRKEQFDVVVFGVIESLSCMRTMEVMHRRHMPYILNIDGLENKDRGKLKNWAGRHFVSTAPLLLSPSQANDRVLVSLGATQNHIRRYSFASYHVDQVLKKGLSYEERMDACRSLGIPPMRYVVSVAQLIPGKNPLGLIKIWHQISTENECLLLVGKGPLDHVIRVVIEHEKILNVRLVSFTSPEKIPMYYRAAMFSVLFSHSDAWGLVISESLANGTPVVATDTCYAASELIVNDGNGQLIGDDEVQLRTAMTTMLSKTPEELEAMSRHAVSSVRTYTIEQMVKEHLGIFEEFSKGGEE